MKKQFIPYDRAVKLKELGFDDPVIATFDHNQQPKLRYVKTTSCVKAPLWQEAFDFFREKHDLETVVSTSIYRIDYGWSIVNSKTDQAYSCGDYSSGFEEARLACLDKLIEIVENDKP